MTLEEWEQRYRERLSEAGDAHSAPAAILEFASRMAVGEALDLACGTGTNAICLARAGWKVTAVDGATPAVEMLQRTARSEGLRIHSEVVDLEKGHFRIAPASFDLILMHRYWQKDLVPQIRHGLRPGGLALVVVLLQTPDKTVSPFRLAPGELRSHFHGWQILHEFEGARGEHAFAEIVARKPLDQVKIEADANKLA